MPKFRKTPEQLECELHEQVQELRDRCSAYDAGKTWEAKNIASSAYKLLHDGTGRTKSLLGLTGKKATVNWLSSAFPIDPRNLLHSTPLIFMEVNGSSARYVPKLGDGGPDDYHDLSFKSWWEEAVYASPRGLRMSRKNIVFTMRTQDGGGHVDDHISDEAYHAMSTDTGWRLWRWQAG